MAVLDALVVLVVAGLLVYGIIFRLARATGGQDLREVAAGTGRWRCAHYDKRGLTHVVVQKVSADGTRVLDEHNVATIRPDDPDYEDAFLGAMLTARQRQAVFESEEG